MKTSFCVGSVIALACASQTSLAATDATGTDTTALEEVVITATKRESTVQTTPISLTVVSQKDIEERGVTDFTSLAQSIPGVSMRTSGPAQTEFEMRGMSSYGGNSPTVGFYLGEVPVSGPAFNANGKVVIDPDLYDLNRVEVLRGPQGTLYGSGSMGGTIKIVPNAPDPTRFEVSAQAVLGDTDGGGFNHDENAMVNIPLGGGTAAVRIVGSKAYESGWIDRTVIASGDFPLETGNNTVRGNVLAAPVATVYRNVNDENLSSVRASVLWKPTDELTIAPSVFYQKIDQGGLSMIDSNPGTDSFYQPFDRSEAVSDRFDLYALNVGYKFGSFDLSSTTSQWYRESDTLQDSSESMQWAFGIPSFYTTQGGLGVAPATEEDLTHQFTEEVRLTSTTQSRFQWLVGYFYSDFQSSYDYSINIPGAVPVTGTTNLVTQFQPVKIIEQAAFGEVSYAILPNLKAAVGLRRYSYDSSINTAISGALSASEQGTQIGDYVHLPPAPERDQGVNPKFDLSYQADDNLLVYGTLAKGFRPGGGNEPVPTQNPATGAASPCLADLQAIYGTQGPVQAPRSFRPDSVWNYEIGEKMRALQNRLTVNGAVYYENWKGVQQAIPLSCGFAFEANAGDAHIYGAELEINAALMQGLILSVNGGYTHARIATVGLQNAGIEIGTPVQDVPDWTSSQSITYRRRITGNLGVMARIENDYVGTRTDASFAINHLPSYDLTTVRAGFDGDNWSAILFAKNAFNKRALLSNVTLLAVTLPTYNRIVVSQPLTVGIELSYRFGGGR